MAGVKISELPLATALQPDNTLVVVQNNETKQTTLSQLMAAAADPCSIVFITDVLPAGGAGIVGMKEYKPGNIPINSVLLSGISDTANVSVYVAADGPSGKYSPDVAVNGIHVTLTETATKRWFTGYVDITLVAGVNVITATNAENFSDIATITYSVGGPAVNSITFGPYPGTQTALKAGDVISFTINTAVDATSATIIIGGANATTVTAAVVNGVATGNITISSADGLQYVTAKARNALGTFGDLFNSSTLNLDQSKPTISAITVAYPAGYQAFDLNDVGTVSSTVIGFDTISYSSSAVAITSPNVYSATKSITSFATGYIASGTNITITAHKVANDSTATASGLVKIATVAPTAIISFKDNPTRLVGSPTGITYEVRVTPNQTLLSAPTLMASLGLLGSTWTYTSGYWKNSLTIYDSTVKAAGTFSNLAMVGLSGISGNVITSGSTYIVGGFSSRTVIFPAFSRVAPMGVAVADQLKTSSQLVGGNTLTLHLDSGVYLNGYYFANADGTYNPKGTYLGLSDSFFTGSNTSGTLEATVVEPM